MQYSRLVRCTKAMALMAILGSVLDQAHASFIPVGVQENVSVSTVQGSWGWQVAYSGLYRDNVSIADVFAAVPAGSYVMYAARPVGALNYTLLAAASESDARTYTSLNTTTTANGAQWYYNGWSMGFAGLGDSITQNSADTQDSSLPTGTLPTGTLPTGINGNLRLSWHTSANFGNNEVPTVMNGGWRAGRTDQLNESTEWERAVLYAPVPEPSTYVAGAMLAVAFSVQGLRSLRRRQQAT